MTNENIEHIIFIYNKSILNKPGISFTLMAKSAQLTGSENCQSMIKLPLSVTTGPWMGLVAMIKEFRTNSLSL